ncbi:MAG TPA: prolipoprotein diacylglyceryl transferase [Fibrobacteres bacterium]|jgi:phosphatidylglycerol:prolipoprotein diacylglycerol transferase|nr:prolipoprotein diacylglyceryl transferase [Fibrobacterota bacterium]
MDFHSFWQNLPLHMDPVILRLGSFRLQWYGLMYLVAFAVTYIIARSRTRKETRFPYDDELLKNIMTYAFLGVLIGGRLGYVLFYNLPYYAGHPFEIILPFRSGAEGVHFSGISGMSYHGGLAGCVLACAWYCRKYQADFWNLSDLFFPSAPLGYTFGRIANFINGELWGRTTDSAIGMRFPEAPGPMLRHPSQLYEALFEGVVLFLILWSLRKRSFPKGSFAGLYLIGYGFFRFFIEFFREPDAQLGLVFFGKFSMGQALCVAMMLLGAGFVWWRRRVSGVQIIS